MFLLKKILTALILPPTSLLFLGLFGLWLARRRPRSGYALVALSLGLLVMLSLPWVANELLRSLEVSAPPTHEQLANSQAIIVLGGGVYRNAPEYGGIDTPNDLALERLRYGARLARQSRLPVGLAGGAPTGGLPEAETMRESLSADFGITARWIETRSRDTNENAILLAPVLKDAGVNRVVLVTHAWHMRRAKAAFEKQGLTVVPAPTRYSPPFRPSILQWLPHGSAMRNSQIALHEWLGILAASASDALAVK